MEWRKLDLEISLKAFSDPDKTAMIAVMEKLFHQWDSMIRSAEETTVMLWCADGSEILEYDGNADTEFEWAKWIGVANPPVQKEPLPPEKRFYYLYPHEYTDSPRHYTYGQLHEIVLLLKATFFRLYGKSLKVGGTFDPGMEFSVSHFKYRDHHEICQGHNGRFVCCYLPLHEDHKHYAGFPDGIPEGLSFGTFFGRQTQHFLRDMEMDYIWFSNGFGFGVEAWGACGAVFDGTEFHKNKSRIVHDAIFGFWNDFRAECPDYPIETRGTNFPTGIDISTDGTPLREIYRTIRGISGPPNSPSGSLDSNYALCAVNYLSHIAELPLSNSYTFRYYLHDPWFKASAWVDYYERSPYDILLPQALVRLDENGFVQRADVLRILTVDNTSGEMPDGPAQEVIQHIRSIREHAPDSAGPVVWIYPFDEYHDHAVKDERLEEIYYGDYMIRGAIDSGLPLNTVISSRNFLNACRNAPQRFDGCILLFPTISADTAGLLDCIEKHMQSGGDVICYGPARGQRIEEWLGLGLADALDGELHLSGTTKPVLHTSLLSAGGLDRIDRDPERNTILAEYEKEGATRPALLCRDFGYDGKLYWIRGTNSFTMTAGAHAPTALDPKTYAYPEQLFVRAMSCCGWQYESEFRTAQEKSPIMMWYRHKNAFYLSGHGRDTTSVLKLRLPDGAPLPCGNTVTVENGLSCLNTTRALDLECRIFLKSGGTSGLVHCNAVSAALPEVRRRIFVMGLAHADILYRPEPGTRDVIRFHSGDAFGAPLARQDDFVVERGTDRYGDYCLVRDVKDYLFIVIPADKK